MNENTTLLRQVHPCFVQNGQMTSQAFMPFPKDKARLSVYDGDIISANDAYYHYTETLNNEAEGTWGVTCAEVDKIELKSAPEPLPEFLSHAVIDFSGKTSNVCRKLAKRLKMFAVARGCLHPHG